MDQVEQVGVLGLVQLQRTSASRTLSEAPAAFPRSRRV
jgi:hypothetical protein